jgi:hypothetical protein
MPLALANARRGALPLFPPTPNAHPEACFLRHRIYLRISGAIALILGSKPPKIGEYSVGVSESEILRRCAHGPQTWHCHPKPRVIFSRMLHSQSPRILRFTSRVRSTTSHIQRLALGAVILGIVHKTPRAVDQNDG